MPATTRAAYNRQIIEEFGSVEMAEEMQAAIQNLRQDLVDQDNRFGDHDQRLNARLEDIRRLTDAVQGLTRRGNTVEPTQRTLFNDIEPFKGRLGDNFE